MVQDHINPDLLFAATEFGLYFTLDGGGKWIKLSGSPTISFRDLTIQRRENDLVAASFGRSFFVLDDYSPLREISEETLEQDAVVFDIKDALWYNPRSAVGSQGQARYVADNPPFGAVFTYYLKEGIETLADARKEREKELVKNEEDIPFPGWEALEVETRQESPQIIFTIKDEDGNVVNRISGKNQSGIHRVDWNLRYASQSGIELEDGRDEGLSGGLGYMVSPGTYTVTMSNMVDGVMTQLTEPKEFEVVPLREGALEGASAEEVAAFRDEVHAFSQDITATAKVLERSMDKVKAMYTALGRTTQDNPELVTRIYEAKQQVVDLDARLNGRSVRNEIGERTAPTPRSGLSAGYRGLGTTYGPTELHKQTLQMGIQLLEGIKTDLTGLVEEVLPALEEELTEAGAPWMEGQGLIGE